MRWSRGGNASPEPVDVLVVCTGNICRSPLLEQLLIAAVPGLTVASAGTGALVGEGAHPLTAQVLRERGLYADPTHVARQLTPDLVAGARLVLTASREHRTRAVELDPTAADRAYTVKELARLLTRAAPLPAGGDRLAVVLSAAAAELRRDPPDTDDDLPDPIGLRLAEFERCAATSEVALGPLIAALRAADRR